MWKVVDLVCGSRFWFWGFGFSGFRSCYKPHVARSPSAEALG